MAQRKTNGFADAFNMAEVGTMFEYTGRFDAALLHIAQKLQSLGLTSLPVSGSEGTLRVVKNRASARFSQADALQVNMWIGVYTIIHPDST